MWMHLCFLPNCFLAQGGGSCSFSGFVSRHFREILDCLTLQLGWCNDWMSLKRWWCPIPLPKTDFFYSTWMNVRTHVAPQWVHSDKKSAVYIVFVSFYLTGPAHLGLRQPAAQGKEYAIPNSNLFPASVSWLQYFFVQLQGRNKKNNLGG